MRTVKWNPFLSGGLLLLGGMLLWTGAARADVSSTNAAAILVFPKIVVDTTTGGPDERTDTIIQITNTADVPVNVRCFWVNANGHCSNSGSICNPVGDPADTTVWAVRVLQSRVARDRFRIPPHAQAANRLDGEQGIG